MNPEIKEQWIAALRSGEYKQGVGRLRIGDKYCCLGVLCDVATKKGFGEWGTEGRFFPPQGGHSMVHLPHEVVVWSGMDRLCPQVVGDYDLAELNDDGETFDEIADLIERCL